MNAITEMPKKVNISAVGKTTPMMEQYLSIKAEHADCLLFYRMGDFYEIFFDDAVQASAALDITLTKRGQHDGKDIPMCGVPVHAHDTYLSRLIRKGFRVAVCEQMEDPAEAKKRGAKSVVKRGVARIVTPGTITEDTLLDTRSHNYLAALAHTGSEMALAWLDMSTGSFQVQPVEEAMLATVLSRVSPGELLCPQKLLDRPDLREFFNDWGDIVTPQADARFDSSNAEKRLKDFYEVSSLDAFGDFNRAELSAAGSLLDYVELTQVGQLPRLANLTRLPTGQMMEIDQATRRNLELIRTLSGDRQGSLLATVDRTVTGAGARLMATRLSAPLTEPVLINKRLDMVQFYVIEDNCKSDLRAKLRETPDIERALSRISLGRGGPRDLAAIRDGLSGNDRLRAIHTKSLTEPSQSILTALEDLGVHDVLVEKLVKALNIELPLLTRDGGYIQSGYSVRLDELRMLGSESKRLIMALESKYKKDSGVDSLKIKHNNVLGYFIEVTIRHADKMAEPFIHRQSVTNAVRYSTLELNELARDITEAKDKALALEGELFEELTSLVVRNANDIALAAVAIAELDWASAQAELAVECSYTRPLVDSSHAFDIKAGRHPVVETALRSQNGEVFVANDCDLGSDKHLWLITGPNMAGKSTFLRQNALIAILAQSGSFVPAQAAHIGAVDRLFSRVGAADDLARGRSTFMVEMVETATILNQATDRSLVILDEIGRGTATFDGLSIAWACVEHLHEVCRSRALFATHYHELTSLTERLDNLSPHAMRVKEWEGNVIFLHEVMDGSADRSYGIHVARLAGLPQAVVHRAEEVLKSLQQGEHSGAVTRLVDDLPLFQAMPAKRDSMPSSAGPSKIELALTDLNPDDLSPREALEALYKLKHLLD